MSLIIRKIALCSVWHLSEQVSQVVAHRCGAFKRKAKNNGEATDPTDGNGLAKSSSPPHQWLSSAKFDRNAARIRPKFHRIRSEFHRLQMESVREGGDEATRWRNVGIWSLRLRPFADDTSISLQCYQIQSNPFLCPVKKMIIGVLNILWSQDPIRWNAVDIRQYIYNDSQHPCAL